MKKSKGYLQKILTKRDVCTISLLSFIYIRIHQKESQINVRSLTLNHEETYTKNVKYIKSFHTTTAAIFSAIPSTYQVLSSECICSNKRKTLTWEDMQIIQLFCTSYNKYQLNVNWNLYFYFPPVPSRLIHSFFEQFFSFLVYVTESPIRVYEFFFMKISLSTTKSSTKLFFNLSYLQL